MSIENVHAESVLLPYNEDTAECSSLDLVFDINKSDSFKIVPRTTEKIDREETCQPCHTSSSRSLKVNLEH